MSLSFLRSSSSIIQCQVVLLDNSQFITSFEQKTVVGNELLDRVCDKIQVPLYYKQYFGLQYIDREDGELVWLNLEKELPPQRKSKPLLFQFAVKVFPRDPLKVEENLQWLILLQVKALINRGKFSLPVSKHAMIDGFYVQATLGDFSGKRHKPGYLEELLGLFYFPPTGINTDENISEESYEVMVKDLHKSHRGMTRKEAVSAALDVCKELDNYGACLHYGISDHNGEEVVFCVTVDGMRICHLKSKFPEVGEVCHSFQWRDIISMFCDNAKFYMYVEETKEEQKSTCHVFRFSKGLFAYKAAQRLMIDAENHQKFFFEDNPESATLIRSRSLEMQSLNRIRNGSLLSAKLNLSFRKQK